MKVQNFSLQRRLLFTCAFVSGLAGCSNNPGYESDHETITKEESKVIIVSFNESASVDDLYVLEPTVESKIGGDAQCREFFRDYYDTWVKFENKMFEKLELQNTLNVTSKNLEDVQSSDDVTELIPETYNAYQNLKDVTKGLAGAVWNGVSLLKLENRRNELYESFSNEKRSLAMAVEIVINTIIYDAYYVPLNNEGNETRSGSNFRCIGEQLKNDDVVYEYLKELTGDFEKLQQQFRELRAKIIINKLTRDDADYAELTALGNRIVDSKGAVDFEVEPYEFQRFFNDMASICRRMSADEQKFDAPVDDWSDVKRDNFLMIMNDIEAKMRHMSEQMNSTPERTDWSPWNTSN
jgi:hypothetical protein